MIKIKIEIPNPESIHIDGVKYVKEVHESPKHIGILEREIKVLEEEKEQILKDTGSTNSIPIANKYYAEASKYEKEIVRINKKLGELGAKYKKRRFSIDRYEKVKKELEELRKYKPAIGSQDLEDLKKEYSELTEKVNEIQDKKEPAIRGVKEAKELLNDALIEMKSLGDAIPIKSYSKFSDIQAKVRQCLNILLGK